MENIAYWILGGALALCAGSFFFVVVPRYAYRHVGVGKVPPLPTGNVSVAGIRFVDVLGVGFFFAIYSAMSLGAQMVETKDVEITPVLILGELLVQGFMIGTVVLILFWRVKVVEFFGLRWQRWYLAPLLGVLIVFLMFSFSAVLALLGYDQWMADLQGLGGKDEAQQDVVSMIKESKDPLVFAAMALVACIGAPLAEEVVFRGYLYPVVKRFSNIPFGVVFTGLLFAAVHGNLAALLPLFLLGMVLAGVYELTGSLWMPIAVHFLFNTTSVVLLKLSVMHPEWFEEAQKAQETAWLLLVR